MMVVHRRNSSVSFIRGERITSHTSKLNQVSAEAEKLVLSPTIRARAQRYLELTRDGNISDELAIQIAVEEFPDFGDEL